MDDKDEQQGTDLEILQREIESMSFEEAVETIAPFSGGAKYDLIISSPHSRRIVESMGIEDLFFLVKDIGEDDCTDLIEMSTPAQVEGFLDLECWVKDRMDPLMTLKWFTILMELDDEKFLENLKNIDLPFVLAFLQKYVTVHKVEEVADPMEQDRLVFYTPDHRHILEYKKSPGESLLVNGLLLRIYNLDLDFFHKIVEALYWELESHMEEDAYQYKVRRLGDRGFPDYYESLEVFRYVNPNKVFLHPKDDFVFGEDDEDRSSPPAYPILIEDSSSLLHRAVGLLSPESRHRLQWEMAYLSNKHIVASMVDFSQVSHVRASISDVHNTLNIALEYQCGDSQRTAADLLEKYYVMDIYRFGFGLLERLRRTARGLVDKAGAPWDSDGLDLFDSPHHEFLEALLEQRPRLHLGIRDRSSTETKDFDGVKDYRAASEALARLLLFEEAFRKMVGARPGRPDLAGCNIRRFEDLRFSTLFLTGLGNSILSGVFSIRPLVLEDLPSFLERAIAREGKTGTATISPEIRETFQRSLSEFMRKKSEKALAGAGSIFEEFFLRLTDELGHLDPKRAPDPKMIQCLLVRI